MTSTRVQPPTLSQHLDGRTLFLARAGWLVGALVLIGLSAAATFLAIIDPTLVAPAPVVALFDDHGMNLRALAVGLALPLVAVTALVGLIFWRRSRDPMALLFALTLLLLFVFGTRVLYAYEDVPILRHSAAVVFALMFVGLTLVLVLFPNGQTVPRRSWWLVVAMVGTMVAFPDALSLAEPVIEGYGPLSSRGVAMQTLSLGVLAAAFLTQVHRYRHVSTVEERQQAKWVVLPFGVLCGLAGAVITLPAAAGTAADPWMPWLLLLCVLVMIVSPAAIANAVLRYRLYAIDLIISRTISYGAIIVVIGGVYATAVLTLGSLGSRVAGSESSDVVIAAAVLVAAAVFRPLRLRVHSAVDRRFNRSSYEADLALEGFVHALRDEVHLGAVRTELEAAAASILQPAHISVWHPAPEPSAQRRSHQPDP